MKKIILMTVALSLMVAVNAEAKTVKVSTKAVIGETKWEKSKDGTWMGMNKTWYKLNAKDASVWMSKDGKKWDAQKDGMWQDKDAKWLKISDKKLVWSADGGKTWSDVPEWKWEGADGTWNKFDKDWSLWTAKM